MKTRFIPIALLLLSAVCSATAAPVLYSFNFTGGNSPDSLHAFSFQYLSPSYITGSGLFLRAEQLSNVVLSGPSVPGPYALFSVRLFQQNFPAQSGFPAYSAVDVQTTFLETYDYNQGVTSDFLLSNGPGGPNVYLDRDGIYTQYLNASYVGGGQAIFSVAGTPEPSTFSLLLLTAPAAWLYRRRKRT